MENFVHIFAFLDHGESKLILYIIYSTPVPSPTPTLKLQNYVRSCIKFRLPQKGSAHNIMMIV